MERAPEREGYLTPEEERALVERAKQGDADAFAMLRNRFRAALLSYCCRLARGNQDDALDLASDTWLAFLRSLQRNSYDSSEGRVYTYLSAIARHRAAEVIGHEPPGPLPPPLAKDNARIAFLYHLIAEVTLREGGPPHQVICACFNQLISRTRRQPKLISEEISPVALAKSAMDLKREYYEEARLKDRPWTLHPLQVDSYFAPLCRRLTQTVRACLRDRDDVTRYPEDFLVRVVGETLLREYYVGDPVAHVVNWTNRVKTRTVRWLMAHREEWQDT